MVEMSYRFFFRAFTFLALLTIFSFGLYEESTLNAVNPPAPLIKDFLAPLFFSLRDSLFFMMLLYVVIYGIIYRKLPVLFPIIYTLAIIHYLISLKTMAYAGVLSLELMRGSFGIIVVATFFSLLSRSLSYEEVKKISFYTLLLTLILTVISIDFSNIFGVPRYQFQFGNPNFAGVFLVSIFCFFSVFYEISNVRDKFFLFIAFSVVLLLVLMTGSRTAITGLLFLLVLQLWRRPSIAKGVFASAIILSVTLYILLATDYWAGRDNRFDLWGRAFSSSSFSLLSGGNANEFKASVEGFYVTLPFTLGFFGLLLLFVFLFQSGVMLLRLFAFSFRNSAAKGIAIYYMVLLWMAVFESIFFGVLTPSIVILVMLLGWFRRRMRTAQDQRYIL